MDQLAHPLTSPSRVSARGATVGLVIVLLALTAFAASAPFVTARAVDEAQHSVVVGELADRAEAALEAQEDTADEMVVLPGDVQARDEYDAASDAVRQVLNSMAAADEFKDHGAPLLEQHERYSAAVEQMVATARRDSGDAEEFEDEHVDPHYDALQQAVAAQAATHWDQARGALGALAGAQRFLTFATPAVFGMGLVLLAVFSGVLRSHQRELDAQAAVNRHQAMHDALTGLPNRTLLRQRAEAAMGREAVALLIIDLDRFKEINDALGHQYGDLVLQTVAARVQEVAGGTATVARLGGDEFAVLLPQLADVNDAMQTAGQIRRAITDRISASGLSLDVDASVGVAWGGLAAGQDLETLMHRADIAMYAAKDRGVGVLAYDPVLNGDADGVSLVGDLRRALEMGELLLHYQPKVEVATGRMCGVEALVRWQHPDRGMIQPSVFIPLAEQTGLIRPLTRYVLNAALAQSRRWGDAGRAVQVAVNVSARNLHDEGFVDDVLALLARCELPPSTLELEVTESAIMADPARARAVLGRLAEAGVRLSLDDFGAGYTSLAHLQNLPVHELKIDRSFVAELARNATTGHIVEAVVQLARNLGLTTVAEGVEDEATWDRVGALGIDVVQGYFLTRPLTADQLDDWIDRELPNQFNASSGIVRVPLQRRPPAWTPATSS